jgi:hypothetical protein
MQMHMVNPLISFALADGPRADQLAVETPVELAQSQLNCECTHSLLKLRKMDRIISFILCLAFCCSYFTIRCIYIISKEVLSNFVAPAFGLEEEKEASSVLLKIPKRNQSYLNSSQEVLSPRPLKFHRTPQSLNNYTRGRYRGSLAYFAPYFQYLTLKCKAFLMAGEQETSILQVKKHTSVG